jgi:hypothetical protein
MSIKVYKIQVNDDVYVGSTTKPLNFRLSQHKSAYKRYINNKSNQTNTIYNLFDKYGCNDIIIELLYDVDVNDDRYTMEAYYIDKLKQEGYNVLNKCIPNNIKHYGNIQGYQQHYRDTNKELWKRWRDANRQHYNEYQRQYRSQQKINTIPAIQV